MAQKVEQSGGELRADAKRNRGRVLVSAKELFTERGVDASLEEIAKRAGVGIGTLYRHFPTRDALLAAAMDDALFVVARDSLARTQTPIEALRAYVDELAQQTRVFAGLAMTLGVVLRTHTPGCDAATGEGQRLIKIAQTAGLVRQDIAFEDLVAMVSAVAIAAAESPNDSVRASRLVSIFFEGIVTRG